ncbi:MAG: prephenate dehydratase [Deltaproteobacteria bacterium]|nr:prephenate dehydratase [Deltaproteobacteria bacterium]
MIQAPEEDGNWLLLEKLRRRIDRIDDRILSLLSTRQEFAAEIGRCKRELGLKVFDPSRERKVLSWLVSNSNGNLSEQAIKGVFSEIISAARSVQEPLKVAYLGPEATFCHQAAKKMFGHCAIQRGADSIEQVFELVEAGVCTAGVVPLENSCEGSVNMTLDLFFKKDLKIFREGFLRIRHHLLSGTGRKEKIRLIYSHPMALAQCRSWLKRHLPGVSVMETESTSAAAGLAAREPDAGAVGSRMSACIYGLKIVEESIQDHSDNVTRFVVIGKSNNGPTGNDKTSLLFSVPHRAGALLRSLEPIAKRGINMTRIESRPMKTGNWEYFFFVDLEGHERDGNVGKAVREMEERCIFIKRLGSYPAGGELWD